MKFLASRRWRIFLIAWMVYSVHFATNVVREHYPAFALSEHGTLRLDEYQGFHSDIFVHRDGHSYINNQVTVSVLAAAPLLMFDPLLDALEAYSKSKLVRASVDNTEYRTDKPNRVAFFRLVKERGLDLRFGAATAITSVFFMAPCSALFLVLFYTALRRRAVDRRDASWLTFLLGFGTPIFFRTSSLNHNMFLMYAMFLAFLLLCRRSDGQLAISMRDRVIAGFCGGFALAVDYMGIVILPLLYCFLLFGRTATASWKTSIRESMAFVLGCIPPVVFLLYTQWTMFGDPFLPAQFWMPRTEFSTLGRNGFTWPAFDLILLNLFGSGYGMFTWAPILFFSVVPMFWIRTESDVLPRPEKRFVVFSFLLLLLFSSANQFARLQWNSGFRYLLPLVPLMFLALVDQLKRMCVWMRVLVSAIVVLHAWVLTVFREQTVQASWKLFLQEGIQLPWFRVLRLTSSPDVKLLSSSLVPSLLLATLVFVIILTWRYGARLEAHLCTGQSQSI